jgi:hypothetical protein
MDPEPRDQRVDELTAALDGTANEPDTPADQPQPEATPDDEAGNAPQQEAGESEEFYDLDLSSVPEDADREWLAKRHREMQAAFTTKTQSLAEQRREAEKALAAFNDPEQLEALLRAKGYDLEDDDLEYEDDETPDDFRSTKEWQEFQQFQQQLQQAQQQEQQEQAFRSSVDELETREGRELDDTEWELLWSLNQAGVRVDDGYDRISQLRKSERKQLVNAKKAPQVSKVGKSATHVPDLSTPQAQADWMAEQLEAQGS